MMAQVSIQNDGTSVDSKWWHMCQFKMMAHVSIQNDGTSVDWKWWHMCRFKMMAQVSIQNDGTSVDWKCMAHVSIQNDCTSVDSKWCHVSFKMMAQVSIQNDGTSVDSKWWQCANSKWWHKCRFKMMVPLKWNWKILTSHEFSLGQTGKFEFWENGKYPRFFSLILLFGDQTRNCKESQVYHKYMYCFSVFCLKNKYFVGLFGSLCHHHNCVSLCALISGNNGQLENSYRMDAKHFGIAQMLFGPVVFHSLFLKSGSNVSSSHSSWISFSSFRNVEIILWSHRVLHFIPTIAEHGSGGRVGVDAKSLISCRSALFSCFSAQFDGIVAANDSSCCIIM